MKNIKRMLFVTITALIVLIIGINVLLRQNDAPKSKMFRGIRFIEITELRYYFSKNKGARIIIEPIMSAYFYKNGKLVIHERPGGNLKLEPSDRMCIRISRTYFVNNRFVEGKYIYSKKYNHIPCKVEELDGFGNNGLEVQGVSKDGITIRYKNNKYLIPNNSKKIISFDKNEIVPMRDNIENAKLEKVEYEIENHGFIKSSNIYSINNLIELLNM